MLSRNKCPRTVNFMTKLFSTQRKKSKTRCDWKCSFRMRTMPFFETIPNTCEDTFNVYGLPFKGATCAEDAS